MIRVVNAVLNDHGRWNSVFISLGSVFKSPAEYDHQGKEVSNTHSTNKTVVTNSVSVNVILLNTNSQKTEI